MKRKIMKGPFLDKNIQSTYQFLLELYREEKRNKSDSNLRESVDRGTIKGIQCRGTDE